MGVFDVKTGKQRGSRSFIFASLAAISVRRPLRLCGPARQNGTLFPIDKMGYMCTVYLRYPAFGCREKRSWALGLGSLVFGRSPKPEAPRPMPGRLIC